MSEHLQQVPLGLYETAIGKNRLAYYLEKFLAFDKKGDGLHAGWNWSAFAFTGFWALYRRMYGWFFIWWIATTAVGAVGKRDANVGALVGFLCLLFWIWFGTYANALYHRKVKRRVTELIETGQSDPAVATRFQSGTGVISWLPKLLGGLVVVGILAAIAIPALHKAGIQKEHPELASEISTSSSGKFVFDKPSAKGASENPTEKMSVQQTNLFKFPDALKAAESGNSYSQIDVSVAYEFGSNTGKDLAQAFLWARRAASSGNADGQARLAYLYEQGIGTSKDDLLAAEWYQKSAEQGHVSAQFRLGLMYSLGVGVPKDKQRAYFWFLLASAQGKVEAIDMRDTMEASSITSKQRTAAQAAARVWKPQSNR